MVKWLLLCMGLGAVLPLAFLGAYHLVPSFSAWWFKGSMPFRVELDFTADAV